MLFYVDVSRFCFRVNLIEVKWSLYTIFNPRKKFWTGFYRGTKLKRYSLFFLLPVAGYYLYIETSYNRFGDRARLGSPILKGSCTLRMFYHMYGQHINALVVYMRTTTNGPLQRKVNMSGNIGDNWIRAEVPMTNGNQPFQVVIEGKLNYISEFAATGTTKFFRAVSPLQQFQIFLKKFFILYVVVKTVIDVSIQKARSTLDLG